VDGRPASDRRTHLSNSEDCAGGLGLSHLFEINSTPFDFSRLVYLIEFKLLCRYRTAQNAVSNLI
jgi:hypothetical protein